MPTMSRRTFVEAAAVAALAGPGVAAEPTSKPGRTLRLGAPIFLKSDDPRALAAEHRRLGYRAAYCPPADLKDARRLADIEAAYAKQDVVIAEVGRWCNLMEADPAKRKANLAAVTEGLALADAIGARCCVDTAGSFSQESWFGPHPDNLGRHFLDAAVENARTIIDAVKPRRAKLGYEMMGWALPDGPESYLRLIKAIDRPGFGVHLDVANAINCPARFYDSTRLINECFDQLGEHIVSCHAKDLVWDIEMNVHFREVPPGRGKIDYAAYVRRVAGLPQQAPLMIEHCANEQEYTEAAAHIKAVAAKCGVEL